MTTLSFMQGTILESLAELVISQVEGQGFNSISQLGNVS